MGYGWYCCYLRPRNRFATHAGCERFVVMCSCSGKQFNILLLSILKRRVFILIKLIRTPCWLSWYIFDIKSSTKGKLLKTYDILAYLVYSLYNYNPEDFFIVSSIAFWIYQVNIMWVTHDHVFIVCHVLLVSCYVYQGLLYPGTIDWVSATGKELISYKEKWPIKSQVMNCGWSCLCN